MNKKLAFLSTLVVLWLLPMVTLADNFSPLAWLTGILNRVITMVLWPLFLALVVIMSIWTGIQFLTARGEAGKIADAKRSLIYIVIAIMVAIIAFSIVTIVKNIIAP